MRQLLGLTSVLLLATTAAAASLFSTPTESKWKVTKGATSAGTVTLLTGAKGVRAEWRASAPKSPVIVFLGSNNKVWVRETGGDVELATYKGAIEKSIVPALLF